MPLLTVFAATPEIRHGIDAAQLQPHRHAHAEARRLRDVEAPIGVEIRRVCAIQLQALLVREEHRHACAVLAVVKDLLCLVSGGVEVHLRRAEHRALSAAHIIAIYGARRGEARERVECLRVRPLAAEAARAAQPRQRDFPQRLARPAEELHRAAGVLEIRADELVAHEVHALERVRGLRDDFLPVRPLRLRRVDGDDAATRSLQVRVEPEHAAIVVHEAVVGVEVIEQLHHRGIRSREVTVVDPVPRVRALPDADDQKPPVIRDAATKAPVRLIAPLVNEHVVILRRADLMEIELLELVHPLQRITGLGRVITRVVEALPVLGPAHAAELHPLQMIPQIRARAHVAHLPLVPVRPARRKAVSHQVPVLAQLVAGERHRAVGRKFVGVEQHARGRLQSVRHVEHALVLQAIILGEKVAPALLERDAVALKVPQLREPLLEPHALGDLVQVMVSHLVLGRDPRLRLRRVVILQPAIRISHLRPVVIVHDVLREGFWIGEAGAHFAFVDGRRRSVAGQPRAHGEEHSQWPEERMFHACAHVAGNAERSKRSKRHACADVLLRRSSCPLTSWPSVPPASPTPPPPRNPPATTSPCADT